MSRYRCSAWRAAILTALVTVFVTANAAEATTIFTFDNFSRAASTTTANTDVSELELPGFGVLCQSTPGACGSHGDFFAEFTITAHAGYSLDVTGFSFDEFSSTPVGPTRFDIYTSFDGFATSILSGAITQQASAYASHATSLSLSGITDPLTVRIVTSGRGSNSGGALMLDNIKLDATAVPVTTAVPEPATMTLLATGLLGAAARLRRKR